MIYSYGVNNEEFVTLCQSQIKLLTTSLGASWSAVYLAEDVTEITAKQLRLFSLYPQTESQFPQKITEVELQKLLQQIDLPPQILPKYLLTNAEDNSFLWTDGVSMTEESISSQSQADPLKDKELLTEPNQNCKPTEITLSQDKLMTRQLVLPLIHEEVMMGLLIAGRKDRYWQHQEFEQVKAVAKTLAIASFLDKQAQWYRQQLTVQHNIRRWEQEQLGDLLHQLRNPLTALRTFSKLLLKRLLPEDRNSSVVGNILRESDRLSSLIDRFAGEVTAEQETAEQLPLTLSTTSIRVSETEATKHNFLLPGKTNTLERLNVSKILEPLLQVFRAIAKEKKIELIEEISKTFPLVKGNFHALREVLNNLLDNAIKYTPSGGKITISLKPQDKLLKIEIADTGYGIPEEDQEQLFARNFRGIQAQGDIPGTGLGLAIAKKLIEQMQGDIEVISPNHLDLNRDFPGTTFTVWLSCS